MKKLIRIIFLVIMVALIIIQFFPTKKNLGKIDSSHILNVEQIPEGIKTMLANACFDCHSDQTTYLWYHKIAPVSWIVKHHIKDGKREINFSNWGKMDVFKKIKKLEDISQQTTRKTMPIKSYSFMHKSARFSDKQISELNAWTEKLSEDLLISISKK